MIPSSEAAKEILTHLLEIGIYALVIFGAVLAFRRIFHNKMRPALRFGLWFLLLLRLTMPFTVASGVHLIVLPEAEPIATTVTDKAEASAQPIRPGAVTVASPRPVKEPGETSVPSEETPEKRSSAIQITVWQWLLIIWASGVVALIACRVWMWGQLTTRIHASAGVPELEIMGEFRQLCLKMHIRRPVRLMTMKDITSPALTIGIKPTVLLPSSLMEEGRNQERYFALLHELTHLKRRDHLTMLWYGVLRCLWWFHPVIWLMEKPFRMDMESACDAKAVIGMSRQEKLAYAYLLLELSGEKSL